MQRLLILLFAIYLQACATIEGPPNPDDPLERYNRAMFAFNEGVDKYALKPLAKGYKAITPTPVDSGITNFFSNLDDIVVLVNDLLQLKFGQAIRDLSRIVYNTTFGVFGLFDVATEFGLPKNNEDFGQTLGYWGLDAGPYLVLPIIGASSIRDGVGFVVDSAEFDTVFDRLEDTDRYAGLTIKYVDIRADLLTATNIIDEAAPDKYALIRDAWIQRRQNLVYDGNPPDLFDDENLFNEDELFEDDLIRPE